MSNSLVFIGHFGSEWDSKFIKLKSLLDSNKIEYSILGRNYMYYEGDYNSGIKIGLSTTDFFKIKKIIEEAGIEELKEFITSEEKEENSKMNFSRFIKNFIELLKIN